MHDLIRIGVAGLCLASLSLAETPASDTLWTGKVVSTTGEPIAGAKVWFLTASGQHRVVSTDQQGRYALQGVPADRVGLWAGSNDHFTLPLERSTEPDSDLHEQDFELVRRPVIEVRLINGAGEPAMGDLMANEFLAIHLGAELQAVATEKPAPDEIELQPLGSLRHSNLYGVARMERTQSPSGLSDPWATLTLDREGAVYVSLVAFQQVIATQLVPVGQGSVEFQVTPQDLLGLVSSVRVAIVHGTSGEPVDGTVEIRGQRAAFPSSHGSVQTTNGVVALAGQLPGRRWLQFTEKMDPSVMGAQLADLAEKRAQGLNEDQLEDAGLSLSLSGVYEVHIPAGQAVDLGNLGTRTYRHLRAKALDADGSPRPCGLRLRSLDPDFVLGAPADYLYVSNDQAEMNLTVSEACRYQVEVVGRVQVGNPGADVWAGNPVVLDFSQGSLRGHVFPVVKATPVKILTPGNVSQLRTAESLRISDADGLERRPVGNLRGPGIFLTPGSYTVTHEKAGHVLETQAFEVGHEPMTLVFQRFD